MKLYYMTYYALNFDHYLLYDNDCNRNSIQHLTICNHLHPAEKNTSHVWLIFSEKKEELETKIAIHDFTEITIVEFEDYPGCNVKKWKEKINAMNGFNEP